LALDPIGEMDFRVRVASFTLKSMSRLKIFAFAALVAVATPPLVSAAQSLHLVPAPRVVQAGANQPIAQGVRIRCSSCSTDSEDSFTVQDLTQSLAARSISTAASS
jgi:hypothetical protein